ncbi:hypothetical protein AMELA_G00018430 [Ameiurus melas]|uniref:Uncharacterized protein n=1 Tax=Ameiurus melas TaxID=219545 RepID=A0A7J6BAY9_AMEME|nr:hypothetical protein AMELA_G00018430 [Ameiurus melas]
MRVYNYQPIISRHDSSQLIPAQGAGYVPKTSGLKVNRRHSRPLDPFTLKLANVPALRGAAELQPTVLLSLEVLVNWSTQWYNNLSSSVTTALEFPE